MADYNINAVTRRVVFTGSAGTGPYAFSFEILNNTDIVAYFNATKLTLTTDFTVTINANGTGSITLVVNGGGNVPQTPVAADQVVIVGSRDIERVTDFVTAGDLLASSLNEQLDALTIFDQQVAEENARAIRVPAFDPALVEDGGVVNMTLPTKDSRAGKTLAFDTNGNPVVGEDFGTWRGDWAASTVYDIRDILRDASNYNIYRCNTAHTSSGATPISSNADAAKWDLVVDSSYAATQATNAANSATAAATDADDANKIVNTNNNVQYTLSNGSTGFSALHYLSATIIQANNSVTQAGLATSAKTDAEAAQTAAETALDLFDDAMLGAKASDPSLDNDGQALADGALYFDTTNDVMKVYNLATTSWLQLTPTVSNQVNINTVAGQVSPTNNIATVAGIDSQITTVAGINTTHLSNVSGVATQVGILGTSDAVSDMNTLGTAAIVTDMDTLADRAADIATLADIQDGTTATNTMQTVVSNLTGVNNFFAQYRTGASDPTTSLDEGDLFYNSTSNNLKYYNGSEWVVATTSVNGTANRNTYTATAGQTTFSATYDVGFVDVYLNGVKLIVSTDFTATNGTSIVLTSGAALNDTVDIVGYGVFNVANVNFSINDATDVNTAGLTNGQILAFNSSTSDFEPVDANAGAALLAGSTFTGAVVVNNQLDIEEVHEKVTVITSTTGTLTFDTAVQGVVLGTANQTANRTINFTNVNSTLAVGQSVTCAVMLSQGATAYYLSAYQVDGGSVTPKWQGGTAPSAGNASSIDAYSFTIIKTADATFTVLASQTQFA